MRPTDAELYQLAEQTGQALSRRGIMLASAESCTGGWVGMLVTAVPGSSAWYERGFITYTNTAKHDMLGVQTATLETFGAVSEPAVLEIGARCAHSQPRTHCRGHLRHRRAGRRHPEKTGRYRVHRLGDAGWHPPRHHLQAIR